MPKSFKASELPDPILLTNPINIEFMCKAEEEEAKAAAALNPITNKSKKRKSDASDEAGPSKSTKKAKKTAATEGSGDLFSITLDGEDTQSVEMLDSCDEMRRKIKALLHTGTITQAQFLRDISRAAYADAPKIQTNQLNQFTSKKGPTAGSTSRVYYASYVYFEKKRIAEGGKKNKHRLDMEARWQGKGGLPRERERGYWCAAGDKIVQDKLGSVRVIPHF
ncbi:putative 37s ribosomal protein [Favolaschia claudopus]|uniref:37s ribosomal protein n=1 Tax=Favolaschia claudopus TaxID=2862362 RepID=A0AAW0EGX9_9AGAR